MEIKSYGYGTDICKKVSVSQWLVPEILTDPLDSVDHAIDRTKEKLSENKDVKNISTEAHMSLDEYRCLITKAVKKGQCDAWDLARRIVTTGDGCYTIDEVNKAFGNMNILRLPVDEVLARDREYQKEKNALHIGDEVEFAGIVPNYNVKVNDAITGYVVGFEDGLYGESCVRILTKHGTYLKSHEMCKKTGKHNLNVEKVMASFEKGEKDGDI